MKIEPEKGVLVRSINQGVGRTGVSLVTQLDLDFDLIPEKRGLSPGHIDGPGIVVAGFHAAVCLNISHLDDIAPIRALP